MNLFAFFLFLLVLSMISETIAAALIVLPGLGTFLTLEQRDNYTQGAY